ncbi:hypothetical protein B7Z17_03455 [Candidatus Saccharibacteria bacterium 32-49-10]|nr:MAG: hypothetical protein B7Z17_03455 [Candidatus Saccharibacteria bacterium 32-49-10]
MTKRNILLSTIIALSAVLGITLAPQPAMAATCEDYQTSVLPIPGCDGAKPDKEVDGQAVIFGIIKIVIQIMTAVIGIVAVGAVIFGAILYGTSGDNPENLKKAKGIWMNVVIGLMLFAFMVAITDFLIPGGVF